MDTKKALRKQMKDIRKNMNPSYKKECDEKIFRGLISSSLYKNTDTILCYVSTDIEVDTRQFIEYALNNGKKVAVPKSYQDGIMLFYEIDTLENLERSPFGIDEPCENIHKRIDELEINNALCIVPALSFDKFGMRLGYGGGYYDRFLSAYSPKTIGICYSVCISDKIDSHEYDVKIKNIITENNISEVSDEQKNKR